MSAKGYWIAFGVGVTAGAAVALLYAPESGAKTRKRIGRSIDDGVDYLEDAADYLRDQAESLSKQAKATINKTRGQVGNAVDTAAGAMTGAAKSIQALM
jgi:gas vesicle protein